jgi:hypothetical protein
MNKINNLIAIKFAFLFVVFCNVIVDVAHKVFLQNIAFKIFDGSTQVVWVSIINALIIIPFLLLFTVSGYLSDKYNKKDIQIDAAINSGNSGGAILNKDNKIVGIAMMKLTSADNISYIVPSIVINTFLNDIKDGKVDGFPQTRTRVQNIENQVMKDYLDLKDDFGVLVSRVDVADTELLENDVLVSINGKKISNDGKIDSKYGKVSFNYEIDTKQIGETVKFEIIRNKNKINVEYKVKYSKPLIPYEFDIEPKYLVFGGLTFTPLSQNYLIKLGAKSSL